VPAKDLQAHLSSSVYRAMGPSSQLTQLQQVLSQPPQPVLTPLQLQRALQMLD
jgi:hypothetical protein